MKKLLIHDIVYTLVFGTLKSSPSTKQVNEVNRKKDPEKILLTYWNTLPKLERLRDKRVNFILLLNLLENRKTEY